MSRHRNVRAMDFDEEYEGYYSCYGHSVEEDLCISPHTEAQFLYNRRDEQQPISNFLDSESVKKGEHNSPHSSGHNSLNEDSPILSPEDFAKLQSCIEAMQNVVGDTVSENVLSKAALEYGFDIERALDTVLSGVCSKSCEDVNSKTAKAHDDSSQKTLLVNLEQTVSKSDLSSTTPNIQCTESKNSGQKCSTVTDALLVYNKERGSEKPLLNLVVIGHVDAGKSTLMGHLLFRLGCVSKKTMHKYEQDSKKLGKASFMYAWILDETSEERNRGITMDVAQSKFETSHRTINLLDAPGHKDFIPNMITGAAQADVAVLVVDATQGEFETGFETGGQTREHTMLIRSLGVSQLAVAINKMDNVNFEKRRYDEIVKKLSVFLKQAGFKDSDVWFIPCSGLTGENLINSEEKSVLKSWYSGPSLVEVIDLFKPPERPVSKPLRMCISDVFKGMSGGFCISGKVEAGVVQNGDKVLIMPSGEQAVVKGVTIGDMVLPHAFAGDHVVLQLSGIDINNVHCGNILCDIKNPVKVSTRFEARLVIFNITVPITKGFPTVVHYQSLSEQGVITKLISQLHRSTGEIIKKRPRCLSKHSSAVVEIEVSRPICLELYKDFRELGRFMLRSGGSTLAAGLVTKVI